MTRVGDQITARGRVVEKFEQDGERCVRVEVSATDQRARSLADGLFWIQAG